MGRCLFLYKELDYGIFIVVAVIIFFPFRVTAKPLVPKPIPRDHTHPLYHERTCLMYRDHNVLLKGLDQGKVLTKTVEIKTGLPVEIENLVGVHHLPDQDILVQRLVNYTLITYYLSPMFYARWCFKLLRILLNMLYTSSNNCLLVHFCLIDF